MSATLVNAADLGTSTGTISAAAVAKLKISVRGESRGNTFETVFSKTVDTKTETKPVNDTANDNQIVKTDRGSTQTANDTEAPEETQQPSDTQSQEVTPDDKKVTTKISFKLSVAAVQTDQGMSVADDTTLEEFKNRFIDAMEAISSMLVNFAQILDITVDELQGSFEQLDISFEAIIETDSLGALMNNLGKCDDISQMLCDDGMLECFDALKEAVTKMLDETGLLPEEFRNFVSSDEFKSMQDIVMISSPAQMLEKISEAMTKDTGTEDIPESVSEQSQEPEFVVTKQTANIDAESDSDSQAELKNTDSQTKATEAKDTKSVTNGLEAFVKGLEKAFETAEHISEIETPQIDVRDMVFQLVNAIKVNISPSNTSLELSLTPETLGKIHLNITSENGVVTAKIETENEITKNAIEGQLEVLKENIQNQGVRVEAIEVTVTGFTFSDSKNAQTGDNDTEKSFKTTSRKQLRDGAAAVAEDEPATESKEVIPEGSTVNYVA